jgi:Flp pilus assembly pilin Flp
MKPPRQPRDEVFMLGAVVMLVVVVLLTTGVYRAWMQLAAMVAR